MQSYCFLWVGFLSFVVCFSQEDIQPPKQVPPHSIHLVSKTPVRLEVSREFQLEPGTEILIWTHHRLPNYPLGGNHSPKKEFIEKMFLKSITNLGLLPKFVEMPLSSNDLESLSKNFKNQITLNLLVNAPEWKKLSSPVTSGLYAYLYYKEGVVSQEGQVLIRSSLHLFVFNAQGEFMWSFQEPGISPQDGIEVKVPDSSLKRNQEDTAWKIKMSEEQFQTAINNLRKVIEDRGEKFFKSYRFQIRTLKSSETAIGIEITLDSGSTITGILLRENTESISLFSPNTGKVDIKKDYIESIRRRDLPETLGEILEKLKAPE
ncbi:MAG: hypothetical protein AABZ60_00410 [Planctomycetota bacterium]